MPSDRSSALQKTPPALLMGLSLADYLTVLVLPVASQMVPLFQASPEVPACPSELWSLLLGALASLQKLPPQLLLKQSMVTVPSAMMLMLPHGLLGSE
ncbi:hypothetical protein FACS189449_04310 [Alphaproteobacteria bacterium]|nr:hypothetical protein FACS189449_04310 [Alphaproteobacteria bacterium]